MHLKPSCTNQSSHPARTMTSSRSTVIQRRRIKALLIRTFLKRCDVFFGWIAVICLLISGVTCQGRDDLGVSISINPDRFTSAMNKTVIIEMTALYPRIKPNHLAWSTGANTIFMWTDIEGEGGGSVMYEEEFPWVGRPVAPQSGRPSHTLRFKASRCDGVFIEPTEGSQTVRRDGRPNSVSAAAAARRRMTSGSYNVYITEDSSTPGELPRSGNYIKPFPVDPKIGSIDFSVNYEGQQYPLYNRPSSDSSYYHSSNQMYRTDYRGSYRGNYGGTYRTGRGGQGRNAGGYRQGYYRSPLSKSRRSSDIPKQIFWGVSQHTPIESSCNLQEFYPAPRAELLVDGEIVARKGEREFLRDEFCLHGGEVSLSSPIVVGDTMVELTCIIYLGKTTIRRVIELRPPGYEPPTDITPDVTPPTSSSGATFTPQQPFVGSSKVVQRACNVGELWGCIGRTSPVKQHINNTCDPQFYCLNPTNHRLQEVTSCLDILNVCYDDPKIDFDRRETLSLEQYRTEAMIEQERCHANQESCFTDKKETKGSGFPLEVVYILVGLFFLIVTSGVLLFLLSRCYTAYYRKLHDVSSIILPWPGKRIYKPTPISASSI